MTQAMTIAQKSEEQRRYLTERKDKLLALLPKQIGSDRFIGLLMSIVSRPEIAECTPASVLDCAFGCARLGLVPDPILGHLYIIPRSQNIGSYNRPNWVKSASIQLGYKGLIELGRRSGAIRSVTTEVVYEGDEFQYWADEHGKHIKHIPYLDRDDDAKPKAVYACAEMSGDTQPQVEVMPWSLVMKIRKRYAEEKSFAWNDPLGQIEMAKKTAVRRSSKLWPQSPELARAVLWDEQNERGEAQALNEDEPTQPIVVESPKKRSLLSPEEQFPEESATVVEPIDKPTPAQMEQEMHDVIGGSGEPTDADMAESARRDAERQASGEMFPPETNRPTRTR